MRLNATAPRSQLTATEERWLLDRIQELKAKLPPRQYEPREQIHAVVVKTFLDGASHTKPVDLGNDLAKVSHGIREAIKQGGEVIVRPLYPDERIQEQKYYPGRERIAVLEAFVLKFSASDAEESVYTVQDLMEEARKLMEGKA